MNITRRMIRMLFSSGAVFMSFPALHHWMSGTNIKDFRLMVYIGSLLTSIVLVGVCFGSDVWSGKVATSSLEQTLTLVTVVTVGMGTLAGVARQLHYVTIFPIYLAVLIIIVGTIDKRRGPGRHELINRVTVVLLALISLTQSRYGVIACLLLLIASCFSIDSLFEERFGLKDVPTASPPLSGP